MEDGQVLNHIERLAKEEHRLYAKEDLSDEEVGRLRNITVELDQCWDLLRQRRGLRDADGIDSLPPDFLQFIDRIAR